MHPMNSIDDKAKNEVQELLQELVVSPVSKELEDNIKTLEESLSELHKLPGEFKVLIGNVERVRSKILEKLSGLDEVPESICGLELKFNKFSDDINACQSSCKEINKTLSDEIRTLCNSISISLDNTNAELSKDHKRLYKQNRISFLIIITLSIINFLALIGLIMIH